MGTHINRIDRKGRVSVPSQFRAVLADQSFQGIILFPSLLQDGIVEGCGMAFLEQLAAASSRRYNVFSDEQEDIGTAVAGAAISLPWDPEGRVGLPEHLVAYAGITEQVAFVGMFDRFQIMHPDASAARDRQVKERLRQNKLKLPLHQGPDGS